MTCGEVSSISDIYRICSMSLYLSTIAMCAHILTCADTSLYLWHVPTHGYTYPLGASPEIVWEQRPHLLTLMPHLLTLMPHLVTLMTHLHARAHVHGWECVREREGNKWREREKTRESARERDGTAVCPHPLPYLSGTHSLQSAHTVYAHSYSLHTSFVLRVCAHMYVSACMYMCVYVVWGHRFPKKTPTKKRQREKQRERKREGERGRGRAGGEDREREREGKGEWKREREKEKEREREKERKREKEKERKRNACTLGDLDKTKTWRFSCVGSWISRKTPTSSRKAMFVGSNFTSTASECPVRPCMWVWVYVRLCGWLCVSVRKNICSD